MVTMQNRAKRKRTSRNRCWEIDDFYDKKITEVKVLSSLKKSEIHRFRRNKIQIAKLLNKFPAFLTFYKPLDFNDLCFLIGAFKYCFKNPGTVPECISYPFGRVML